MNEDIKFSIIVPMYNISNYIEKCIDSILNQTYYDYEIIIVNDGSTDNSLEIVNNKYFEYDNIKIVSKKNGGLSSARNYGLNYVSGNYIWFVDGDDYIDCNALEILSKHLAEQKSDITVFQFYVDNGRNIRKFVDRIEWNNKEKYPLVSVSAWSKVYKTSYFIDNGYRFAEGLIYEDLELNPFLLATANSISFIKEPLYYYVHRENSIMLQKEFKKNKDDKFIVLDRLISKFQKENIYDLYKEQICYLAIRHLIMVYSIELFDYGEKIYKDRFLRVINFLNYMDKDWIKNRFLKESPKRSIIYAHLFKNKLFGVCKLLIKIRSKRNEN